MIDGEGLLRWQKHWDRSPGMTTVMCMVLTQRAKALMLILYPCWGSVDKSLDCQESHRGLLKIQINFSLFCECYICFGALTHMSLLPRQKCYKFSLNNPFSEALWWVIQSMSYGVDVKQGNKTGREWTVPRLPVPVSKHDIPITSTNQFGSTGVKSRGLDTIWWSPFHTR